MGNKISFLMKFRGGTKKWLMERIEGSYIGTQTHLLVHIHLFEQLQQASQYVGVLYETLDVVGDQAGDLFGR